MSSSNRTPKSQQAAIAEHITAFQKAESERFQRELKEKQTKEKAEFEERLKKELKELEQKLEEERRNAIERMNEEAEVWEVEEGDSRQKEIQPVEAQRGTKRSGNGQRDTNPRNVKRKRVLLGSDESEADMEHDSDYVEQEETEVDSTSKRQNEEGNDRTGPTRSTRGVLDSQDRCLLCAESNLDCVPSEV